MVDRPVTQQPQAGEHSQTTGFCILIGVCLFGLYGMVSNMDYTDEVVQERDALRQEVINLHTQLELTTARCGEACRKPAVVASDVYWRAAQ